MDKNVFLWGLTPQEFQKMLINALEQVIEPLKPAKESRSIELLTRKETAELLRISLPTLAKWSEQGIIHAISMGGRIYYSLSEIQNILEKKGAAYQHVYFPVESEAGKLTYSITAFPTTMVVDRNGNIVGEAILGGINNETQMKVLQDLIDETLARDMATLDKDMMMKPDGN